MTPLPIVEIVASSDNLGTVASGGSITKPLYVNDTLNGVGNFDPTLVNITITDAANKGVASINPTTGEVTYTPNAGVSGIDSLIYQICDKLNPAVCDTALVVVTITPIIEASYDNLGTVASGGTVIKPLFVNDTLNGVGNFDPNLVNVTVTDTPKKGIASIDPTTGQVTYTPSVGASGVDSLIYQICDKLNPAVCDTALVVVTIMPPAPVVLLPKVYLQGTLFGILLPDSLMRDDLRVKGFIPTTSPYPGMGLPGLTNANVSTLAVVGQSSAFGRDAIVDWVFVELRSSASPTTIVDSRSALVQRDGDIVDVDGVSPLAFNSVVPGSFYVAVRHRNHLGVMTAEPIALTSVATVVDFRKPSTPTYNLNAGSVLNVPQVPVEQGVAMWAGNALFTNTLDGKTEVIFQGTDNDVNVIYQQVLNSPSNTFVSPSFKLKGYYVGDINMNGETIFQGTGNDPEFIYQNVLKNHVGNTFGLPNFKIREQLP